MHLAKTANVRRPIIDRHQGAAGRVALPGESVDGRGQKAIRHAVFH